MVSKFRGWLGNALKNLSRIGNEPILIVGLAMEALHAYEQAQAGGLNAEDAAAAAVIAILTLLGRQLVYPATKVDAATNALKSIEPELEKPFTGE